MLPESHFGGALHWMRGRVRKAVARDRRVESHVLRLSRLLWPWPEARLVGVVLLLVLLDYLTTVIALQTRGEETVYERGIMAGWALEVGGLGWLFLIDAAAVATLCLLAVGVRHVFHKLGFGGFARAGFVVLLWPYGVVALAAVVNNLVLAVAA